VFSLETRDEISSMLNKFLIIGFILQLLMAMFLNYSSDRLRGEIVVIGIIAFLFYKISKNKSRILSALIFSFWIYTIIDGLMKGYHYNADFLNICTFIYIILLGFILYLTILFHQKSEE